MKEKLLMLIYFLIAVLFITFVFIRVKQDKNYLNVHDIKLDSYMEEVKAKGYLAQWDSVNNTSIVGTEEGVDVTYKIVDAIENKANTKGYKSYYLEMEASFQTFYKVDEDGSISNKTSYVIFAPDFYDSYTGLYFVNQKQDGIMQTKIINYKDKEYKINYKLRKEEIKSDWNIINENYKTMDVVIKYYINFEVPNNYNGLIMGINGAYNGFVEDSNLWYRINNNESYILDSLNTESKLFSIKTIMKEG